MKDSRFDLAYRSPFVQKLIYGSKTFFGLKPKKVIYFFPELPDYHTAMYKICQRLGYRMINNGSQKYDLAVHWHDATFTSPLEWPDNLSREKIINGQCLDISKHHIQELFSQVAGYDLKINPRDLRGKYVVKSDLNAIHDGHILTTPTSNPNPNNVYQKLIESRIDDNYLIEYRVPIFLGTVPIVYRKLKRINDRFGGIGAVESVQLKEPDEAFSLDELRVIIRFAEALRMDYGELDILRDNDDKKIYIIDANSTPFGPSFSWFLATKAVNRLARIFKEGVSKNQSIPMANELQPEQI